MIKHWFSITNTKPEINVIYKWHLYVSIVENQYFITHTNGQYQFFYFWCFLVSSFSLFYGCFPSPSHIILSYSISCAWLTFPLHLDPFLSLLQLSSITCILVLPLWYKYSISIFIYPYSSISPCVLPQFAFSHHLVYKFVLRYRCASFTSFIFILFVASE